jgi:hypothetical protein
MDDLSGRAAGSLAVTGQGAGGVTSRERAMTAPGTAPAAVDAGDKFAVTPPVVEALHYAASNRVDGGGQA